MSNLDRKYTDQAVKFLSTQRPIEAAVSQLRQLLISAYSEGVEVGALLNEDLKDAVKNDD